MISNEYLEQILDLVKPGCCVVLDDSSAELFHWTKSPSAWFERGAIAIKQLSSFSQIPKSAKFLLFVVDDIISKDTFPLIRDLVKCSSAIDNVDIVTAYSENFHASVEWNHANELEMFDKIRSSVRRVKETILSVNIHHIPMLSCFVDESSGLFIAPSFPDSLDVQLEENSTSIPRGCFLCYNLKTANSIILRLHQVSIVLLRPDKCSNHGAFAL